MPGMKKMTVRLSPSLLTRVEKLSEKLQVDKSDVIRIAITRLAEAEGIGQGKKPL
jgi:predicted transcriptional regulator